MERDRGRDNPARAKRQRRLRREVYVFTEGAVTEPGFVTFVTENGTRKEPDHEIVCKVENRSAPTKRRKPLPLVEDAVTKWHEVRRAAKKAGIKPDDWNWPQVWCLFDRDQHEDIPTAFAKGRHLAHRAEQPHEQQFVRHQQLAKLRLIRGVLTRVLTQ